MAANDLGVRAGVRAAVVDQDLRGHCVGAIARAVKGASTSPSSSTCRVAETSPGPRGPKTTPVMAMVRFAVGGCACELDL